MGKFGRLEVTAVTIIVSISILGSISTALAQDEYPNTPIGVTQKLFSAMQENDANQYLDAITPEDRSEPGFFFYRQLVQGIFAGLGLGDVEAAQVSLSFSNMQYRETYNDGNIAHVQVAGTIRDLNLAMEDDFSAVVVVHNIEGTWLVSVSSEPIIPTPTPQVGATGQRDAIPPQEAEHIEAANAFEDFAIEQGLQYRNATYETVSNDGTFAVVRIVSEVWYSTEEVWVETSADVDLRFIGGNWRSNTSNTSPSPTSNGQAVLDTANEAITEAADSAAAATSVALSSNLGGTLAYVLDDKKTVEIISSNGSKSSVSPLTGEYVDARVDILELAPTGDGFYFSQDTDWVTPAIYFYDFASSSVNLMHQFGGQRYVKDMAIAPNDENLVIALGSFVGSESVWLVPTSGSGGHQIWAPQGDEGVLGVTWDANSNSIYMESIIWDSQSPRAVISNMTIAGAVTPIGELQPDVVDGDFGLVNRTISVSPNASDIVYGGGGIGVLNVTNGSIFSLVDEQFLVCNPAWSQDGNRLVFASWQNKIWVFDLASGEFANPYNLPVSETHFSDCPLSVDWIP